MSDNDETAKRLKWLKENKYPSRSAISINRMRLLFNHQIWLSSEGRHGQRLVTQRGDFSNNNLDGVDFSRSVLTNVVFTLSSMKGAGFAGAELRDVSFFGCDLENADFSNTRFENVSFEGAHYEKAKFDGSDTSTVYWTAPTLPDPRSGPLQPDLTLKT